MAPILPTRLSSPRHASHATHKRIAALCLGLLALAVSSCGSSSNSSAASSSSISKPRASSPSTTLPVSLVASEAGWQLKNPLSRMVLLPAGNGSLVILGGLTASDTSASGIFRLNLSNGSLTAMGRLPAAVHDAAGVAIGSNYLVMGGGSVATVGSVESSPATGGNGTVVANLPQPRSDCSAVAINGAAVIAGGYNGSTADPSVLETTNGISYKQVSSLKVPVRYTALAANGNSVYAFGGLNIGGSSSGQPSSVVQKIDLSTGMTSVVGSLPIPLEGAMAFSLNGHIYLAGGDTGSGSNLTSSAAVWSYQGGSSFTQVSALPFAVSNAGIAVSGGVAWIVGGEHNGKPTAAVQTLEG